MRPSQRRGCALIAATLIIGMIATCALTSLAVAAQAITPPAVLVSNNTLWVGDRCRADENYLLQHDCLPGYTVDLVVFGSPTRHYTVVHIPALRDSLTR